MEMPRRFDSGPRAGGRKYDATMNTEATAVASISCQDKAMA
jgi:hypothetical protein